MDIAGTKKKLQRMSKVAEETYKKMNQMLEKMQTLQEDMEQTSEQVDRLEYETAVQGALLKALCEEEGIDIEAVVEEADLPTPDDTDEEDLREMATSRPSVNDES